MGTQWMLENHSFLDARRVVIIGWSRGGLITLIQHPKDYAAAYAGVPASDLVARMGYESAGYAALYSAPYHIGKIRARRRDGIPQTLARLSRQGTGDAAAHPHQRQRRRRERARSGAPDRGAQGRRQEVEYKIYQDAPGGHYFNRIDTKLAKESRREVYQFLAGYLKPDKPVQ
jgi:dienelactone hydrolase